MHSVAIGVAGVSLRGLHGTGTYGCAGVAVKAACFDVISSIVYISMSPPDADHIVNVLVIVNRFVIIQAVAGRNRESEDQADAQCDDSQCRHPLA